MAISIDTSVLTAYYQARAGLSSQASASTGTGSKPKNPTPPWSSASTATKTSDLVKSVLAGGRFINPDAAKLDAPGASKDYKPLFAVYQGLSALQGLADEMQAKGLSESRKAEIRTRFDAGMAELGAYLDKAPFTGFQLAQGTPVDKAQATVGVKRETDTYTTGAVHSGTYTDEVAAFQGQTAFSMALTKSGGGVANVDFDLAEMGSTPRTMSNVVIYFNDKLAAAGVQTRFAVQRTPGAERTTQAGGQTVSLGTGSDSFSLQIKGVSNEVVSFTAAAASPSVYLGATVGNASADKPTDQSQLLKFQTDPAGGATAAADGKVFAKGFGPEVQAVRSTATAADGSLYVLADIDGAVDGQKIKGGSDVALQKYDSAGNLVYSRTLGAAEDAQGLALAVSADGSRVAVGGSVTGGLNAGETIADPELADSFVSVFDAEGQEVWSRRQGAAAEDKVVGLTFGADGALYVQGAASSAMGGATALGGQDGYIQGFAVNAAPGAAEAYTAKFTVQYGTAGVDKPGGMAVNGSSLVVAGVENGDFVLRQFDLQASGAPTPGAVRDLGFAEGGSVAGVAFDASGAVVVAGTTRNGALSAGTVNSAYASGQAAFVAKLAGDLGPAGSDRLTYLNGVAGDRTASAVTLVGSTVYLAGQLSVTPPSGQTSAFDGYAAAVDADTGAVSWSQTFRGADRMAAPTSIAVDSAGASVLDRLGLPRGTIDYTGSQTVTANSAVRAGDQFYVRSGTGSAKAVTIEAGDTLKTLAEKIRQASGFNAKVEVINDNGYDRLKITPATTRTSIEIEAGKGGRDALAALGLGEGLVTTAPDKNKNDLVRASYGLTLPSTLSLDTDADVKQAQTLLTSALSTVKSIYRNMTSKADTSTASSGEVPAYLTKQISNYQAALARLTGS